MGTISEKKIESALAKARNLGIVEEDFTIEDCAVVLRNLRPEEYAVILKECEECEGGDYVTAYQKGHISRALVEVNGVDLRETDFVEVEEVDPKTGATRQVSLELHSYLERNLISSWSKEAVFTAYRKFGDVVLKAEKKAKEGIKFEIPDETPEEKFRRILGELKEAEEDVPSLLLDRILEDAGYMRKSTAEEVKSAMDRANALAREQIAKEKAQEQVPEQEVSAPPTPPRPSIAEELMRKRQPLNRQPVELPVDPHQVIQQVAEQSAPPAAPILPAIIPAKPDPAASHRAQQIAAMEGGLDLIEGGPSVPPVSAEVAELRERPKMDPEAFSKGIDQPPLVGINPRYRPPSRL
jgi:hypothetical protein